MAAHSLQIPSSLSARVNTGVRQPLQHHHASTCLLHVTHQDHQHQTSYALNGAHPELMERQSIVQGLIDLHPGPHLAGCQCTDLHGLTKRTSFRRSTPVFARVYSDHTTMGRASRPRAAAVLARMDEPPACSACCWGAAAGPLPLFREAADELLLAPF